MIFKGDIGTKIILNTGSNLASGTVFKIYYRKPDGTTGSWTAQKESDDLSISYTTLSSNDLNVVGTWVLQSYVEISGWKGFGQQVSLTINAAPPGTNTALTTLTHLREYLKKDAADTGDDTFLEKIIRRISSKIEKKCGRTFIAGAVTEYYKGNGLSQMLMRRPPVNSVTSIHIDADRVFGSDTLIDASDIVISEELSDVIILDGDIFDKSNDVENVKIVYNGGYATIPDDLEDACLKLCAIEYIEARRIHTKIEGERDLESDKDKIWKFIVNNYRISSL